MWFSPIKIREQVPAPQCVWPGDSTQHVAYCSLKLGLSNATAPFTGSFFKFIFL